MKTEEAIEFINQHIRQAYYMGVPERMKANDINRLLRRGKKFEAIVKGLKEEIAVGTGICANWLRSDIKRLEQKYFPKKGAD